MERAPNCTKPYGDDCGYCMDCKLIFINNNKCEIHGTELKEETDMYGFTFNKCDKCVDELYK